MQNLLLDFTPDKTQIGFRLQRLEMFNWGTFDKKIWKIEPYGFNSLLTGDIGSGKSTLVDAITTMLVPHHKIIYNKAAGAEGKERTLFSYVRGEYTNRKNELDNSSKPVFLRSESDYTVLVTNFCNEGYNQKITLAQVFWNRNEKIEKFFVVSEQDLNIIDHFKVKNEEKDIFPLKKRLKNLAGTKIFENFSDYSSKFRNIFGIKSEKALDLFYQTVSLKSVGNLTEFVRNHMLDKFDVKEKIEGLKKNFENLTKSYEAVQIAKKQLQQLQPLVQETNEFEKTSIEIQELQSCLNLLPIYFAIHKSKLLHDELKSFNQKLGVINNQIEEIRIDLERLRNKESEVKIAIDNNKESQRLKLIENELKELERIKQDKLKKENEYLKLLDLLEFPNVINEEIFYQSLTQASDIKEKIQKEVLELNENRDNLVINLNKLKETYNLYKTELESLRQRKTQIPLPNLQIREMILRDLSLKENELAFVGELVKVNDKEKTWEGAIERVLHNFGLSILVPEEHYRRVSNYVDKTNLKGRLVYFKVHDSRKYVTQKESSENSLLTKIEIKSDTLFYDWLENYLTEIFDYDCCDTIEQFQKESKAITKNGQIKGGKAKHEKDDRKSIFERKNYILGWSNLEKIKAIEIESLNLETQIKDIEKQKKSIENIHKQLKTREINLHDLIKFKDYSEINWKKAAVEIETLKKDKEELEKSSDQLKSLKKQLEIIQKEITDKDKQQGSKQTEMGVINKTITTYEEELKDCNQITEILKDEQKFHFSKIEKFLPEMEFKIKTIDKLQEETRGNIENSKEDKNKIEEKLRDGIISKMQKYINEYRAETTEVDASIKSIHEFKQYLKKIEEEDLPKHEKKFRELLNEGTINDIAIFKNQLNSFAKDIEDKIKQINKSLNEIEYNSKTYIKLLADKTSDIEIRDFQIKLVNCLENTFGETNLYSEEKFNKVKLILDRFNSGTSADISWTNKVTDVRYWFSFSASERLSEDDLEKEYYSDSSGKSGGQKEKLAYTILAAALAYKFGLEWSQPKSRSFRFVVIDEAFGRGSDESTRYGLELFSKLNLQLLIVTPLQKINIIENYIHYVHFVSNENGSNSLIKDLTIQEYRTEKERKEKILSISEIQQL
ncbi:MAG: AAA family ATPase [Candidatus Methanoperedens sp.]|nr:AAA family ATPase [Candidatus Methanoperedens sp.]